MSQIFLLDIFVSHVRLYSGLLNDAGNTTFIVKVHFCYFSPIEIRENNVRPKVLSDNSLAYLFHKGQILYFFMKTDELVNLMKKNLLRIGVYRDGDSFPVCQVQIPLFGCACSLISGDCGEEFPKVFTMDGPFNLLDPGNKLSGQICINVAFADYGRFVDSQYSLQKDSFIFKNSPKGSEFECFQLSVPEYNTESTRIDPRTMKKIPDIDWTCKFQEVIDNCIRDLVVVLASSRNLSNKKPPIKTPHISSKETEDPKEVKQTSPKKGKKKKN